MRNNNIYMTPVDRNFRMDIFDDPNMKIPSKTNELYQWYLSYLPELDDMGIYGIYYNEELVYIGKSTDFCKRFLGHTFNTLHKESKEYNRPMYKLLRDMHDKGTVEFKILELAENEVKLRYLEAYYIDYYKPILNKETFSIDKGQKSILQDEVKEIFPEVDKDILQVTTSLF